MSWTTGARAFAAACMFVCINSYAQTSAPLVNEVHTVAAATQAVPVEETFNITTAGTYQVTLTDLGAQLSPTAPLASATLAITTGSTVVGTPLVATTGSTSWNTTFSAQPGTYVIHVVGAPTTKKQPDGSSVTVAGSGSIGIQVTNTAGGAQVASFSGILAFPSNGTPNNVGVLNDSFTVTTAGSYQVTLTDMQLPTALTTLTLAIVVQGGALVTDPAFGTTAGTPTATATVALQPGVTYQIFAGGQAGGAVNAGLYGVNVSPTGGGAPVYTNTIPVGAVISVGKPALTAGNYTLTFADLAFPSALSQAAAAVTLNGLSVAQLSATGTSSPFSASATPYQVFALGLPASGGQGSYSLSVQPINGTPVLNIARAVSDPTSGVFAYSYDSTTTSQAYTLDLADFGYPASFASIQAAAVQAGALLSSSSNGATANSLSGSGSLSITPAAGPISLLVFAKPTPAATSGAATGGLFGIDLTETGAGAPAFQTSQGVGQLFSVQTATVSTGGSYQAVVKDLGFPANFGNLAVIVTRGTSKIGSIFGGGTLQFNATGGDYLINFVAQPTGTAEAGTYSIVVEAAPPAAAVTLQTSATSVSSGGTVTLTWSAQNTSSCAASSSPAGAWSGTVAASGTATSAALTATTTFTLTCVGTDGTNPLQTVTVTVNSSTTSSHGGGGAIGADVVALLLGLTTLRALGRVTPRMRERQC
jgi:hypothetical protein